MNEESISEFEVKLSTRLPDDYRTFLATHADALLVASLVFNAPRSGIVDRLLTIQEIQENDRNGRLGILERSLLHIGENLMGGFLYIKVSDEGFGEVHYSEKSEFREVFPSFSDFMKNTHKQVSNK
jgi:hypothetical protein